MINPTSPATGAVPGTSPTVSDKTPQGLRDAAEAFEAVFLRQMIGSMRSASLAEDIFSNQATDQFRDLQDAQLADAMAEGTKFGIAEMLLKQFEAAQEADQ